MFNISQNASSCLVQLSKAEVEELLSGVRFLISDFEGTGYYHESWETLRDQLEALLARMEASETV